MSKGGRPGKYETHVKPRLEEVKKMAASGCTNAEIGEALGISKSAFCEYQNKYKEFMDSVTQSRLKGVAEVKKALYNKAVGFEYEEKKTYIKRDSDGNENKYTEITKRQSLPDSNAIQMYLRNYDKNWLDKDQKTYELKEMEIQLRQELAESNNF